MRPARFIVLAAILLLSVFRFPSSVFAWGGRLHVDINRAAAKSMPDEMDAWREYAKVLGERSYYPDLWKDNNPSEDPRHFIDLERYDGIDASNLPRRYEDVQGMTKRKMIAADGIAPWAIMDLQARLISAMKSNNWTEAAAVAAAMGHYVADLHQPLHTTENYDGALTVNAGVHLRWEEEMPRRNWTVHFMQPAPPGYVDDPWPWMLGWIAESHARHDDILAADRTATTAGRPGTKAYYDALWASTQNIFIEQANAAATHLASLWYTAWVDAGRPEIPGAPESLPETSVWHDVKERVTPSSVPFFIVFGSIVFVVVVLSIFKRPKHA